MLKKKEIEINEEELKFIHRDDFGIFKEKIITTCYCFSCAQTTITNNKIFLNNLNDTVLSGFCKKCGNKVNRYVETGEAEEYQESIEEVKRKYIFN